MKTLFIATALLFVASISFAGQESRYYDAQGRYVGRSNIDPAIPNQQNVYDPQGRYQGRVMTSPDGSQRFYDSHGNYMGRGTTGWSSQGEDK